VPAKSSFASSSANICPGIYSSALSWSMPLSVRRRRGVAAGQQLCGLWTAVSGRFTCG
jgi:hypothetical protein